MSESMITVGIPFHNDSLYLDQSIRSVFNQTYNNWCLILIDDGSTDGSLEIAKRYAKDPRVTIVSDGSNKKLAKRLNQIIDLAKTKYIARMDADDIMHTSRLEEQFKVMQLNPNIDVLGSNAISIDENNNVLGVRGKISEDLIKVEGFIHPSILAKTEWFKSNRYDEFAERSQDILLWNRTKHRSNFFAVASPLLYYREVEGSYYKKYFKSSASLFKVLINNRYSLSKFYLTKTIILLSIKGTIYLGLSTLNKENILISRRNIALDSSDLEKFSLGIKKSLE